MKNINKNIQQNEFDCLNIIVSQKKSFILVVVVVYDYVVLMNVVHKDENKEVSKMPNETLVMLKHKQKN